MSGTSLDGLDICLSEFEYSSGEWKHDILQAKTIEYSKQQKKMLLSAYNSSGRELMLIDAQLGKWLGEQINEFKSKLNFIIKIDVIGSHGHTLFHEPRQGFSTQIGSGAHIAAITGIPCVSNFRMGDVARGGQGAPLVPIGDELLFNQYFFCLNLGGFANISFKSNGKRTAFDISPANMALNYLAQLLGKDMDSGGDIGKRGDANFELLDRLNKIGYYNQLGSKSLGREWFDAEFLPIINSYSITVEDKLRTVYEHIAQQIGKVVNQTPQGSVQITGGGAKNTFLVEVLKRTCLNPLHIPSSDIIDFKEAHIFGFLALLFILKQNSALASVTGAHVDSIAGCLNM